MNTDAMDRRRQDFAAARDDSPGGQHGGDMGATGGAIVQDGVWLTARRQGAVFLVSPVSEDLDRDFEPQCRASLGKARMRGREQDEIAVVSFGRARDGRGERGVAAGIIAQRSMRFDVADESALRPGEGVERADLIEHQGRYLLRRTAQRAPSEALEIRI